MIHALVAVDSKTMTMKCGASQKRAKGASLLDQNCTGWASKVTCSECLA